MTPWISGPDFPGLRPNQNRPGSNLQPFLAHRIVRLEFAGRALEHDAAVAHDIDAMGYPHRDRQLLLHQEDGDAAPCDFGDEVADVGSSRVDLQACKLEYSIVSPK